MRLAMSVQRSRESICTARRLLQHNEQNSESSEAVRAPSEPVSSIDRSNGADRLPLYARASVDSAQNL
jgi:hypothetical protein